MKTKNKLSRNAELGRIVRDLISREVKPGGPYYSETGTIDRKTNRNIAKLLASYDVHLPALDPFLKYPAAGKEKSEESSNKEEKKVMSGIRKQYEEHLASLPTILRKPAKDVFEKTIAGNPDKQMPLISHYLRFALGKKSERTDGSLISQLGMLNIMFWTAFIIYDDFWDRDEKADPMLLPIANMFARTHAEFFSSVLPEWDGIMDKLDAANCWEIKNCRTEVKDGMFHIPKNLPRFGDYTRKYEPASGHILGPLLILRRMNGEKYIPELLSYFKHLLISMQLNDDMHDFEEDLRRGHLSTAVVPLLRDLPRGKRKIDLKKEMPEMKKIFWTKTIPGLAKKTVEHAEKARQALRRIKMLENPSPLLHLADRCANVGKAALVEYGNSMEFMDAYLDNR